MTLCECGCGQPVVPNRLGRPRRYVDREHYLSMWHSVRRHGCREMRLSDDLPDAHIEALIQAARAQQRYARVTGGAA
jgi:hypothetical protein